MKAMELSERFFEEIGLPAFREACPELVDSLSFGLAGEGSECFGFDDETSQDHDWGAGFCVWTPHEKFAEWAPRLQRVYDSLPATYMGYPVKGRTVNGEQRIGVQDGDMFFYQFTGNPGVPDQLMAWFRSGEETYAAATNGKLFLANDTKFARDYAELKKGYPEDIRLKKIAARAVKMAQSGQYNYVRCMSRGNRVAAFQAMAEFVKETCSMIHLLNHAYCPFYKWMWRSLSEQPILGSETSAALERLTAEPYAAGAKDIIEEICVMVKKELQAEGLSSQTDDFLLVHGPEIMSHINDARIRSLPVSYA